MSRMHLFELEDQSWCPRPIRETTTDFLLSLYMLFNIYEPAYQKIIETLDKTNTTSLVDCCSGSGGTLKQFREYLNKNNKAHISMTLTDKYPNLEAFKYLEAHFPNQITGHRESLDATQLSPSIKGMRTFFSSFHHFAPEKARKILQNAVDCNAPIGIFECTQRDIADFMRMLFSPLCLLFFIPVAKRLTWKKFLLTYVLPITPFTNMWDYFVSNMRTYSEAELRQLVNSINAPHYHWEIGKLWSQKAKCYVPYLIGYNAENAQINR